MIDRNGPKSMTQFLLNEPAQVDFLNNSPITCRVVSICSTRAEIMTSRIYTFLHYIIYTYIRIIYYEKFETW